MKKHFWVCQLASLMLIIPKSLNVASFHIINKIYPLLWFRLFIVWVVFMSKMISAMSSSSLITMPCDFGKWQVVCLKALQHHKLGNSFSERFDSIAMLPNQTHLSISSDANYKSILCDKITNDAEIPTLIIKTRTR